MEGLLSTGPTPSSFLIYGYLYLANSCESSAHNRMLVTATVDITWRIKTDLMAFSRTTTVDVIWRVKTDLIARF